MKPVAIGIGAAHRSQKNPSRIQHLARRTLDITSDTDDPSCVYLSNTVPNLDTLTSAARPAAMRSSITPKTVD
jgi:hypothetical protein